MSAPYSPGRCSRPRLIGSTTHDRQGALGVGRRDDRLDILELAEEVGVLEDDGGGLVGDGLRRSTRRETCPSGAGDGHQLRAPGGPGRSPESGGTRDGPTPATTTSPYRRVIVSAISIASAAAEPPS